MNWTQTHGHGLVTNDRKDGAIDGHLTCPFQPLSKRMAKAWRSKDSDGVSLRAPSGVFVDKTGDDCGERGQVGGRDLDLSVITPHWYSMSLLRIS